MMVVRSRITRAAVAAVVGVAVVAGNGAGAAAAPRSSAKPAAETTPAGLHPYSDQIALVPDNDGDTDNGGELPLSGFPNDYAPTFTDVSLEAIDDPTMADPLAGFDTVVLVGVCDIDQWLAEPTFTSRVEGFVTGGGKLIIWDSECESTDYSGFVLPFTTDNPGQNGATGSISLAENNSLASTDPTSASFVDLSALAEQTDAVGDSNVFTTSDPRWYADMIATNSDGVTGATQAYARLGSGLVIYSGLDKDYAPGDGFDPDGDGANQLDRVWMLQLLAPWSPDQLPGTELVTGLSAAGPAAAEVYANTVVSAHLSLNAHPVVGAGVSFAVTSGPCGPGHSIPRAAAVVPTDGTGIATWSYSCPVSGTDTIAITATLPGGVPASATVSQVWMGTSGTYVALGDSYSAGEGDPPFYPNTAQCHRSPAAYGPQLNTRVTGGHLDFIFGACSGAIIANVVHPDKGNHQPAQISLLNAGTRLVSLTMGGNDIEFPLVVAHCAVVVSCEGTDAAPVALLIRHTTPRWEDLYRKLLAAAPNAQIYVLGYPRLFGSSVPLLCNGIDKGEGEWMNLVAADLDSHVAGAVKAVKSPRLHYVNALKAFDAGKECVHKHVPYFNGLDLRHPEYSFHPKPAGQLVYEQLLAAALPKDLSALYAG